MKLLAIPVGAIIAIVAVVVIVIAIALWLIGTYNSLIARRNAADVASSDMDIYLKKRYDMIPNLVETVKGYAKHESEVLTSVTEARAKAAAATTTEEKIEADGELTKALRAINIVAESYPELKADKNFLELQKTLAAVESDIANSRRYYNAKAGNYNEKILKFPTNIVAKMFNFKAAPLFAVDDPAERKNVKVQF